MAKGQTQRYKRGHENHKMWGKRLRKGNSFLEGVWAYFTKSKENIYRKGLTYLKNRAATNKKHTIDSQMPKRRENKHEIKGNYQTTKRKRSKRRNKESTGKQSLKWQ